MLNQSGGTQAASDSGLTGDECGALQDLVQSADIHDSLICWVNVRAAGEDRVMLDLGHCYLRHCESGRIIALTTCMYVTGKSALD
jgi:hypothetical protein